MLINLKNAELNLNGNKVLKDIRLQLERGNIYGLLGPNGAGKSSTIYTILGLYTMNSGKLELFDRPVTNKPSPAIKRRIGVMPERTGFYDWMSADKYLTWHAGLYGNTKRPVTELLELVGLGDVGARPIRWFSLGMRRRLSLARALVHIPELLILDEPTNGLDPRGRREVHDLLLNLAKQHKLGILLCTHLLDDVDRLCSHIGIINHGRTVLDGPLSELVTEKLDKRCFRMRVEHHPGNAVPLPPGVSWCAREGEWHRLVVEGVWIKNLPCLWEELLAIGWRFTEIREESGGLEELYLRYTTTANDDRQES